MGSPVDSTLLMVGSGPGIGVAVASVFAQNQFDQVALLARNISQLQKDRDTVIAAAAKTGRNVNVKVWKIDIGDLNALTRTLDEVRQFGIPECVYFNAARVGSSGLFEFPYEGIEEDFRVTNIALYVTARWALPLLLHMAETSSVKKPSLFVTSSLLPADPIPELFSLSMVKAAQENLVTSLEKTYSCRGVHIATVVVGGPVSPDASIFNATNIASQTWKLFSQVREDWTRRVIILEDGKVKWE